MDGITYWHRMLSMPSSRVRHRLDHVLRWLQQRQALLRQDIRIVREAPRLKDSISIGSRLGRQVLIPYRLSSQLARPMLTWLANSRCKTKARLCSTRHHINTCPRHQWLYLQLSRSSTQTSKSNCRSAGRSIVNPVSAIKSLKSLIVLTCSVRQMLRSRRWISCLIGLYRQMTVILLSLKVKATA